MARVRYDGEIIYLSSFDSEWGDAPTLSFEVGGDDIFIGEDHAINVTAYGDGEDMYGSARGGADAMTSGSDGEDIFFAGDALFMSGHSVGGRDYLSADNNSEVRFVGDAGDTMSGNARGGNDTIMGSGAVSDSSTSTTFLTASFVPVSQGPSYASSILVGDAYSFGNCDSDLDMNARGGKDEIIGRGAHAGDGGDAYSTTIEVGDAYSMWGDSKGGNDSLEGGSSGASDDGQAVSINIMNGDGYRMGGASQGGKDSMWGGGAWASDGGEAVAYNIMAGDGYMMDGTSGGGNDAMYGGDAEVGSDGYAVVFNVMAGDTFDVYDTVEMGKDKLTGGSGDNGNDGYGIAINLMFGDVGEVDSFMFSDSFPIFFPPMSGKVATDEIAGKRGWEPIDHGNDVLTGGEHNALNILIGDAMLISDGDVGGNDELYGGGADTINLMVGDGYVMYEYGVGGNDKLYSGVGNDMMFGDSMQGYFMPARIDLIALDDGPMDAQFGGADKFYFDRNNGHDQIGDFNAWQGDKIVLRALGDESDDFAYFAAFQASGRIEEVEGGVLLRLDVHSADSESNTVMLVGVNIEELTASAFIF
ncbi:hypothetical protein [Caenimonas sp. SL110]|uniref:hypothetical protein n=1 Tax=Caenimonas sp. SL110 TaxID=1450524 RepID=UPI0006543A28|nr:hypothetical protein [Caenimonas sp. SL110]